MGFFQKNGAKGRDWFFVRKNEVTAVFAVRNEIHKAQWRKGSERSGRHEAQEDLVNQPQR
jgi:hypothetical protein